MTILKSLGKRAFSDSLLEARREKDRLRQQRYREQKRAKLRSLPTPDQVSRDNNVTTSRDVTQENREDKSREEKTTTEKVRLLLSGTSIAKISNQGLDWLEKRHGREQVLLAADIAAEMWRRNREDKHNPGGYLHSLCRSLVVPDWYVPYEKRRAIAKEEQSRKKLSSAEKASLKAQGKAKNEAMGRLWNSLSAGQHEEYRKKVRASLPDNIRPSKDILAILAKSLAWEESQA